MELFMRELKQIAIVCAAIVAAVSAWADIPNVFDLDLDAPREEAPTVVPTRPPIVFYRNVRSMVEFRQIIGRGTRTYSGKPYFKIYDFTGATENFKDDDWWRPDVPCPKCGMPRGECICEKPPQREVEVKLSSGRDISAVWESYVFFDDEMMQIKDFAACECMRGSALFFMHRDFSLRFFSAHRRRIVAACAPSRRSRSRHGVQRVRSRRLTTFCAVRAVDVRVRSNTWNSPAGCSFFAILMHRRRTGDFWRKCRARHTQ